MRQDLDMDAWRERASYILDEILTAEAFALIDSADPWSTTSLDATEQRMLGRWASVDALPADVKTQYEAFLGEGLRRRVDGAWVRLDPAMLGGARGDVAIGLGIASPSTDSIDVVSSLVPQAFRLRVGTWWSAVFRASVT